jgi:hypothetical protein
MKKQKNKVSAHLARIDPYRFRGDVDAAISMLVAYKEEAERRGFSKTKIFVDYCDGYGHGFDIRGEREETDEEYKARLARYS